MSLRARLRISSQLVVSSSTVMPVSSSNCAPSVSAAYTDGGVDSLTPVIVVPA